MKFKEAFEGLKNYFNLYTKTKSPYFHYEVSCVPQVSTAPRTVFSRAKNILLAQKDSSKAGIDIMNLAYAEGLVTLTVGKEMYSDYQENNFRVILHKNNKLSLQCTEAFAAKVKMLESVISIKKVDTPLKKFIQLSR